MEVNGGVVLKCSYEIVYFSDTCSCCSLVKEIFEILPGSVKVAAVILLSSESAELFVLMMRRNLFFVVNIGKCLATMAYNTQVTEATGNNSS